jgi:hypothetical protein
MHKSRIKMQFNVDCEYILMLYNKYQGCKNILRVNDETGCEAAMKTVELA